jgi:hypothetical protein
MCRLFPFPPTCSAGATTILALIGPASAIAGFGPSGFVPKNHSNKEETEDYPSGGQCCAEGRSGFGY